MTRGLVVAALVTLSSCANISADTFEIGRMESASVSSEYGSISTLLLFQDEGMLTYASARHVSLILESVLRAYAEHFGHSPAFPRSIALMELRESSSVWVNTCWDDPNDPWEAYGCSAPGLLPGVPGDWHIAIPSRVYQRGSIASDGVIVHELLHGLLYFDGRDDYEHTMPGVWESDPAGVYHRALELLAAATSATS